MKSMNKEDERVNREYQQELEKVVSKLKPDLIKNLREHVDSSSKCTDDPITFIGDAIFGCFMSYTTAMSTLNPKITKVLLKRARDLINQTLTHYYEYEEEEKFKKRTS